jgi:hypothetical protein
MLSKVALAVVSCLLAGSVIAAETPVLDKRQTIQEKRVDQGVASGELTKREARRLEDAQARLAANEAKAKSDGTVTAKERAKLDAQADSISKRTAKQKHDRQDKK